MSEQPLHVMLANTIKEVDMLVQLHRESLAFIEAKERLDFLHQLSRTLLDEIQSISRWIAFSRLLQLDDLSQYDVIQRELPEVPRSLGGAIVEGNMIYIRFIVQVSGALSLIRERKLMLVRHVSHHLSAIVIDQEIQQVDDALRETFQRLHTLAVGNSPDVYALCQPILERFWQHLYIPGRDGNNYGRHEGLSPVFHENS